MSRDKEKKWDSPSIKQHHQQYEIVRDISSIYDDSTDPVVQGQKKPHSSSSTESTIGIITAIGRSLTYKNTDQIISTTKV